MAARMGRQDSSPQKRAGCILDCMRRRGKELRGSDRDEIAEIGSQGQPDKLCAPWRGNPCLRRGVVHKHELIVCAGIDPNEVPQWARML
jgi:hypothetical protein